MSTAAFLPSAHRTSRMEDGTSGTEEHLNRTTRLFERLAQIPGYTWEETHTPYHPSYDNWYIFGVRNAEPDALSTASSSEAAKPNSIRSSPRLPSGGSPFPHSTSDDGSDAGISPKEGCLPVFARVSTRALRLEREYHLCKSISQTSDPDCKHIVRPIDLILLSSHQGDHGPIAVSIFESPGCNYLQELISFGPAWYGPRKLPQPDGSGRGAPTSLGEITLPHFLDFAIGACECLELLHHGQGIVHGELRGDAFHFNAQTSAVKLVNFGSGARSFEHYLTSKGWSTLSKEAGANNKLQYIAPEMTGRMQAEPDSRTDIYSLGVLLWILLTLQWPFEGEAPMEIVQNVLSRRIPPVSSKRLDIPLCLSHIIQKMTMKQIDERYHSTSGLKRDLIEVQKLLADGDSDGLENFKVGLHDVSSTFCLPSSMIGRKEEHDKIVRVIEKVSKRHGASGGGANGASNVKKKGLFSISSNSSISEGRLDNGDGSSDGTSSHGGEVGSRSNSGPAQGSVSTINHLGSIPEGRGDSLEGQISSNNKQSRTRGVDAETEPPADLHRHSSLRDHDSLTRRRNSQKHRQKGRCEVVSIAGAGGMGKSTLSRSISVEARRNGYFASAKFDQAQKTPFGPVLRLLSSLFKQLFSESEVTTEFHQTVRSYVRPHWTVLHRMLDLPEFLLGQPTGLSKSNSISTHHYSSRKSSVAELKRRDSSPLSMRSSIFSVNSSSRPASDFLRGGSSTRSLRFMNTFLEVLRLFAQHKFICLCLDDLQFADEESLELISNIVSSKIRLVLIVTYREREILGEKVRSVLESENATITKIKLSPLNEEDIVDYVAATLYRPREYAIPLAAVLQEKTQGNPFYMREMLDTCHRKSALWYDWKSSSWVYDLDRVFKEFETPNYAEVLNTDFITRRLQELPSSATSILAWSSLLGTSFSFSLVQKLLSGEFDYDEDGSTQPMPDCGAKFVSLSHEDAVGGLQCALQSYVILATDEDDIFRFAHDRYVQAAASLRECRNMQKMHLIVAQVIMKYYPDEKNIYVRSDHVCQAIPLILKRFSVRREFRDLLSQAAQKASESGARHAAINYYCNCIQLLQPDPWTDGLPDVYYNETLQLFTRAAECYWYQGHFNEALSILQITFNKAKTPVDKAPSWVLQSRLFAQRRDSFGCVQSLKQCLSTLGLRIKEDITWEECDDAFHKLRHKLQGTDRAELLQAPRNDDPVLVAVGAVLVEMVSSCYWSDSLLFYNMALELVSLHLDHGAFIQAGVGYTHLAMIAVSRFNMVQFATEMGEISLYLIDRSHDPLTSGRGGTVYPIFVGHLRDHVRDTIPQLENATENSVVAGDRILTLLSLGATAMNKFYCVDELEDIETFCAYVTEEVPAWSDDTRGGTIVIAVRQTAKALMGKTQIHSPLDILSDETHDSREYVKKIADEGSSNGDRPLFTYFSFAIAPLYLYGHYDRAIECGTQCIQNLDLIFSVRSTRFMLFYLSLSLLAVLRREQATVEEQPTVEAIARIRGYKKKIEDWQVVNNINYFMWSELLDAELCDITGDCGDALRRYEAALDHAQMHGFILEEALANELMGEFCLRRGSRRAARNFIEDSVAAYYQIGASGKANHVSKKHQCLLKGFTYFRRADAACQTDFLGDSANAQFRLGADENDRQQTREFDNECSQDRTRAWLSPSQPPDDGKGPNTGLPPSANLDMIDLASILTSSQVISSEVDIDRLLAKMCEIILESTGGQADFAAIIVEDEHTGWSIAAYGDAENGVTSFIPGRPFSDVEDQVSMQAVLYAIRFREVVFLHNLIEDERFSNVPESWLARNTAGKAIIALPIIHGGNSLVGVLYLEGQPNSFTDRNLTVLQLLSNQIGISIANALLFKRIRKVSASNVSMIESQKRALTKAREAETKAKVAEAEAQKNMKLKEEASMAKSMFLANVSHELRTPLNGVIGMSELLKATNMSSEQQEFADSIRVCADTLLTVINDILDFSKLEAGKVRVTLSAFNLEEAIRETIRALAYTHHDRQLNVVEEFNLPQGLVVIGDFYRLRQILMNLLSNSYKFTPNGSVTVCVTTDYETRDTIRVTTSIADTGIGINQDQLKRLFLPFSQADSSTARKFGGTGLGLSICKSLIENVMDGKIWMKSTEGVGTTVYFTLTFTKGSIQTIAGSDEISTKQPDPMAIYSPSAKEATSAPLFSSYVDLSRVPRDQIRICVAEDNPINQKIALSFVKKLGFQVDAFENGLEAVEALRKEAKEGRPYHLVLMDVQMPILDGYEATKFIRKDNDPAVRRVLIIAMTASAIRGDREKCLEAGMNNYLAKPVKAATLKEMLEQYLHQPAVPMPNLQQDAQEIAKLAMRDLRRIPPHKPKNRIDTQITATDINAEVSTTDAKQISPKTTIPPRTFKSVENGFGTSRNHQRK